MDRLQKGRWYGVKQMWIIESENVWNIQQNHKLHHESHGKMEHGNKSRRTNPSRGENPGQITLTTTFHYSNEATELHT